MSVHLLQNVSTSEAKEIHQALIKLGYQPTEKALFTKSQNAIIITKVLKNEREPASLSIELVRLDDEKDLPRTVFRYRLYGDDVTAMLQAFPKPEAFSETAMPVASTGFDQ